MVLFPAGVKNFYLFQSVQTCSLAHPSSSSANKSGSFLGVKRPGREVDHSPLSSDEAKNEWSYISTPPIYLNGVNRDSFTFTLSTNQRNDSGQTAA
jgi:hypothetical protein